ncbi:hypothetical protein ACX3PU_10245, partial [Chryseobacterium sp. A301]
LSKDFKNSYSVLSDALLILKHEEDFTALALTHYYLGKVILQIDNTAYGMANAKRHFLIVDSLFSKYGFFEPELRSNYRYLIQSSESKTDPKQKLYYFNQLIKLDSIGNREAAYMASTVLREFDPATESVKSRTNAESMKDRMIQLLIILSIGGGLFLLIYFKPKRSVILRKGKLLDLTALRTVEGPSEP